MHIDQAEKAIGSTVAHLGGRDLRIGQIVGVNELFVYVRFYDKRLGHSVDIPCLPFDLVFYYGPLMQQLIANVIWQYGRKIDVTITSI